MAHILLVEDDPIYLELVQEMLERDGHTVKTARNGRECLTLLDDKERSDERPINLVITDLFMPRMNGAELVVAIRERGKEDMPLIGITGGHSDLVKPYTQSFLRLGSNAVLAKPFGEGELRAAVSLVLGE